ncbi:MAG: ATP-dependent Clp protease adapter ClpS [Spirochaetes bacterium]|nr:ATP-dependent Clp protease adapter ClpS [Spirochaetota bacterium]
MDTKEKEKVTTPKMFKVLLHNDDYTTMEFVVEILVSIFHKTEEEATQIMLDVHRKGRGLVGVFTYDIAVTKANQVHQEARKRDFPLKCTVESE